MAKQLGNNGGGKWTIPSPSSCGPTPTSKPKSGVGSSVSGASKRAVTPCPSPSAASTLSAKNKHHGV